MHPQLSDKQVYEDVELLDGEVVDIIWQWKRYWSCPLHNSHHSSWEDCPCPNDYCDGYALDCPTCETAEWKPVIPWEREAVEVRGMSRILHKYYLPQVVEMLNSESAFPKEADE